MQSDPAFTYGMTAPSSSLRIPKLVPIYQNKNFSKMRHILPAIQPSNQNRSEPSLIKKQIEATKNAIEFERERYEQVQVRKNELLVQKRSRRITNAKSKELDRKLQAIDE